MPKNIDLNQNPQLIQEYLAKGGQINEMPAHTRATGERNFYTARKAKEQLRREG